MQLLNKEYTTRTFVVAGQEVLVTQWIVKVERNGVVETYYFDHDPTDQEILSEHPVPLRDLTPTTREGWQAVIDERFSRWWRWKQTRIEAELRGVTGMALGRLQGLETNAWNEYINAVTQAA